MISETLGVALFTAVVNAAVTWGVISTKMAWLRRDVDDLQHRVNLIDRRHHDRREAERRAHEDDHP